MLRPCFLLFSFLCVPACTSSSSSTTNEPPPAQPTAPPAWTNAPTAPVDLYEGRVTEIPVTIRAKDPSAVQLVVLGTDAPNWDEGVDPGLSTLTTEAIVSTEPAPAPDVVQAKLVLRLGYNYRAFSTLRVAVNAGSSTTPLDITVRLHKLSWKPHAWKADAGPQTREHGVFAIDPDTHAAFLLQGSGYSPQWKPIEDSWRFDLTTGAWSAWTPTGDAMSARAGHRSARVPGGKVAFVHGGYTGFGDTETTVGDLYRVDFGRPDHVLTKLAITGAGTGVNDASVRNLHAIAYDEKGDQLVIFGGVTSTPSQIILGDTWLVKVSGDSSTWTKLTTPKAPSARYGAFYAFDEASRRFVVWSGGQYPTSQKDMVNAATDAWALDLSATPPAWSKLATIGKAPPGRRNGCVMHDPIGRRLFVFGGTPDGKTTLHGLSVLNLEPGHEEWTQLNLAGTAPPTRSSGFGFATPDGSVACGFGNDDAVYSDVNVLGYFN